MLKRIDRFFIVILFSVFSSAALADPLLENAFDAPGDWQIFSTAAVHLSRRVVTDSAQSRLCIDYAANDDGGNITLVRTSSQSYPANFSLQLTLDNNRDIDNFQMYQVDSAGGYAWFSKPIQIPHVSAWQTVRFSQDQLITSSSVNDSIPLRLRKSNQIQLRFHVAATTDGHLCFASLTRHPEPMPAVVNYHPVVTVDTAPALQNYIVDGNPATYWLSGSRKHQTITLDLGASTELGGAIVDWIAGLQATRYSVRISSDGRNWNLIHSVAFGLNPSQWLAFPATQARYIRFDLDDGLNWRYGLKEIRLQPPEFSNTPNAFVSAYARNFPLGRFPPFFSQNSSQVAPIGADGGHDFAVMTHYGAIELAHDGISVEPMFVVDHKKIYDWANIRAEQHLVDDYLPIPSVSLKSPYFYASVTAFNHNSGENISTIGRYTLQNTSNAEHLFTLALAVRPFRASQMFNAWDESGGVTPINQLSISGRDVHVNGGLSFTVQRAPDIAIVTPFEAGIDFSHLLDDKPSRSSAIDDSTGLASGLLLYTFHLGPGESQTFLLSAPLTGQPINLDHFDESAAQASAEKKWRRSLNVFRIELPGETKSLLDSFRTAYAHALMCRDWSAAFSQPQSYTRCHFRNHYSVVEPFLRLGQFSAVRDFLVASVSDHLKNRLALCCQTSTDPSLAAITNVGAWIHAMYDDARFSGDKSFSLAAWPHLAQWFASLPDPSSAQTPVRSQLSPFTPFGVFPAFAMQEATSGVQAPRWESLWTLVGLANGAQMAKDLQKNDESSLFSLRGDALTRYLTLSTQQNQTDKHPAAHDLAVDFDRARRNLAAITPIFRGVDPFNPQTSASDHSDWEQIEGQLHAQTGDAVFLDQWQTLAAMIRARSRERAWRLAETLLQFRQPVHWNQWPTSIVSTPSNRFFHGDLPDVTASANFINAVLDFFVYEEPNDKSLVIASGFPLHWFTGTVPIIIEGIHTPYGLLNYQITHPDSAHVRVMIEEGTAIPPGGIVLYSPFATSTAKVFVNHQATDFDANQAIVVHAVPTTIDITLPPNDAPLAPTH